MSNKRLSFWIAIAIIISTIALYVFTYGAFSYFFHASDAEVRNWWPRFAGVLIFIRPWLKAFLSTGILAALLYMLFVERRWINSNRKEILLSFITVLISLTGAEVVLRKLSYVPAQLSHAGYSFRPVDTLITYTGYVADENGMTYIDPVITSQIRQYLDVHSLGGLDTSEPYQWKNYVGEFKELAKDFRKVQNGVDSSAFTSFYNEVKSKGHLDFFDSMIIEYVRCPINSDGFRSISFRRQSAKKRILLIGDSFAYGHTTTNKVHSFYDLLLSRGYEIYNTGLSGADPPQYLAVAQKYIPLLKPDLVIVNFYLGNDIQYFHQQFPPYQPYFYPTNGGYLFACPRGVLMKSKEDAYRLVWESTHIPVNESLLNRLAGKTVITTLLWGALQERHPYETKSKFVTDFEKMAEKFKMTYPDANDKMKQIRGLCDANNSKFAICIVPNFCNDPTFKLLFVKDCPGLFPDQSYFEPNTLNLNDYSQAGDKHFIESGHKKYHDFMQSVIDSLIR